MTKPKTIPGTKKTRTPRQKKPSPFVDTLSEMLTASLREKQDFIITFEKQEDDEAGCDVHVMAGNLINPCMLNTLKHRVSLFSDEGARVMTRRWE